MYECDSELTCNCINSALSAHSQEALPRAMGAQ